MHRSRHAGLKDERLGLSGNGPCVGAGMGHYTAHMREPSIDESNNIPEKKS